MVASPITETYEDVRRLIYHVCNQFARRYGGDVEELISDANVAYMKAYESWKPGRGTKFSTYVVVCVWRRLAALRKAEQRRKAVWSRGLDDISPDQLPVTAGHTIGDRFADLLEELSEDTASVVRMVVNATSDISEVAEAKGGKYRNWRSTIRSHLRDIGWTHNRIRAAFEEIEAAF